MPANVKPTRLDRWTFALKSNKLARSLSIILLTIAACAEVEAAEAPGLVAHWTFDEGAGATLHDSSGNDNRGTIHGATWVAGGAGHALKFDGVDDYVDCGKGAALDLRDMVTVAAWVYPEAASSKEPGVAGKYFESYALTLYRGGCWWYISGGGNNVSAPLQTGQWHHVAGTFDGSQMKLYVNGVERASKVSKFERIAPGKNFLMGCIAPDPSAPDAAKQARGYFQGLLDEVKVYERALSFQEVVVEYNRRAAQMNCTPLDTSWFGQFRLKTYYYFDRKRLIVDVDALGVLPLSDGEEAFVDLVRPGAREPIARRRIQPTSEQPKTEITFSLAELPLGQYEVRALLQKPGGREVERRESFEHLEPVCSLPDPEQETAPPLPAAAPPVRYDFALPAGGGFFVTVGGETYPVESSYSFPQGGTNRLVAQAEPDADGELQWQVRCRKLDDSHYEVTAGGAYYAIRRRITLHPNRIVVEDAISNKSQDVLGVILSNHVDAREKPVSSVHTEGRFHWFLSARDHGLGMIALDDIYQLQQEVYYRDEVAAMVTDKFGLDIGAAYTVQWAVYPTATGDYFEFINTARKVEGVNRTIEGAFRLQGDGEGLVTAEDRRTAPTPEELRPKAVKYVSFFYLIAPEDDPGMSLEGIEFAKYPKESELLRKTIAETHRLNPGVKVMFHIAHGLYATNKPEQLFPDSRVIDANGTQIIYGPDSADYYCRYFSRERFDEGYRWWIFYPTLENSFGKAMLSAIDYMLDYIGASGMYADGFASGYARGGYTYDIWDGHSVEVDPETKTVKRKMGNVTYLSLPVLKAVARKVAAKGGIVITNGRPGPRSLWKENYITTCETSGGDQASISRLYLGPAVTAFGDPRRIKSRRDLYLDILAKLQWGALYCYYGDRHYGLKEKTLAAHMFPFTLEELHAGWIQGKERIVTRIPGVYGWRGDRRLHRVYRSDSLGMLVPNQDFSTVDATGVRTQLRLGDLESAVAERIPVVLETTRPVNVLVEDYSASGLEVRLNGRGKVQLVISSGEFPIKAGRPYRVVSREVQVVKPDRQAKLAVPLELDGEVLVRISPP